MDKRALVIGASGLVGSALVRVLEADGWLVIGTARFRREPYRALDITAGADAILQAVSDSDPRVILLPAAFTNVDACDDDPVRAQSTNVDGVRDVASAARAAGALLVYYSTDYIFDGTEGPYDEDAHPHPVGVYARTKADAEEAVRASGADHLTLRTTVVYGWDRTSKNFAMQVWRKLGSGQRMRVPSDQVGNPTLADYLAEVTLRLIEMDTRGVVNVVGRDRISRVDFARRLARTFGLDPALIDDVSTAEFAPKVPRPLSGGLTTARLEGLLGTEAMPLGEALKRLKRQWRSETHVAAGPKTGSSKAERLKQDILEKVAEYYEVGHQRSDFVPFTSRVSYAGRVYGAEEMINLVDASLDFWLTLGPWGDRFEHQLKTRLGVRDVALVNSGSSANLTAVSCLIAPQLKNHLRAGDEVITPAATFPTTIAPLLQNQLVPVLVDSEVGTYNIDANLIEAAIGPRTRAMMIPHTLGNPCNLSLITDIAKRHDLFLIEDCCDALGSMYDGRPVGTFGDLATVSFYPAHHITMGEGGAVISNRAEYSRLVRSIRDWGRDCWCAPGETNTCGKRFGWQLGSLPQGYDHKYTYSNLGYNLKPTDLQAAIGVAQLHRLDDFVRIRRRNFELLYTALKQYEDRLILPRWEAAAEPAWFGFPLTVRHGIDRRRIVQWLEDSNIETRELFAGNIMRQPGYMDAHVRIHGVLTETDRVAEDAFFIGVFPGLATDMIDFILARFAAFFERA